MRAVRALLLVVALIVAGIVATWQVRDPERRTLDDAARAEAPGSFVKLEDGVTHYEVAGPDSGRVVVLGAGFSVPEYIWDPLFGQLADAGYRVIRLDWYGRGWSDRVDGTYDQDLFVRQINGLLDSLGVRQPVTLVGLSFGGAVITSFADRHPDRVRALVYVDPVFVKGGPLPPELRTRFAWNMQMVWRGGTEKMAAGQAGDFLHPEAHPDWVARYRVQQQFRGTREALRRSRVAMAAGPDQQEQLRRVGAQERPVLVVWGRQDSVAPFSDSDSVMAALPRARLVAVDSAAHLPHIEQPGIVSTVVRMFLLGLD